MTARQARRKFLHYFPDGFKDETYLAWERDYKWSAARAWQAELGRDAMRSMRLEGRHDELAATAVRIESRTNLLFSFEKMALRDAIRAPGGAELFADGLFDWLWGPGSEEKRFEQWCEVVGALPRRQTRVATWPVITIFGFLARPKVHVFLKPMVTRYAAEAYGRELAYSSRAGWDTYGEVLDLARDVKRDLADLQPRDMIDIQSFLWVQGSDEYP
jgi:hypothetical protein